MKNYFLIIFIVAVSLGDAEAIILNIDSVPSENTPFASSDSWHSGVGRLVSPILGTNMFSSCTAQAISSRVLITAAHCTNSGTTSGRFSLDVDNDAIFDYTLNISGYIDHPGWSNDERRSRPTIEYADDISLILLSDVLPDEIPIYRVLPTYVGMPIALIGYGLQGIGGGTPNGNSLIGAYDRWIGANVLEPVVIGGSVSGDLFKVTFDDRDPYQYVIPPSGCTGPPGKQLCANPGVKADGFGFIEANIASGDSGGGVFYQPAMAYQFSTPNPTQFTPKLLSTEYFLVGINSFGGNNPGSYGVSSGFVDIVNHIDWINSALADLSQASLTYANEQVYPASTNAPSGFSFEFASIEDPIIEPNANAIPAPSTILLLILGISLLPFGALRPMLTAR